jgi:transposase
VITVETVGKIRRRHFVKGESISRIARETGLSRNTVKRYLRNAVLEPHYSPRLRQAQPKLGAFVTRLETLLEEDERRPSRERRTAQRLFEALHREGYAGAYDSVRRFVKGWHKSRERGVAAGVFIPLYFAPGEAYQFDWSHEVVEIGGLPQMVKVAHVLLCHGRVFLAIAYPRESQEMLFDAHERAFRFFGGVARRGIYDNMKTAVDLVFTGRERRFNRRFLQMASHYLVEPVACTPAAGWEKGRVENQVGNVREWLFTPKPRFKTLADLNVWLERRCREIGAQRPHPEQPQSTCWEVFVATERVALVPLAAAFDGFAERECRGNSSALVNYDRNRYSVECSVAGKVAAVRAYADRIVVVAEGRVVAEHAREFGRDKVVYNPWHYVPALARKPGALRNGAPFRDWDLPAPLAQMRSRLAKIAGGDRQFVEILAAAATDGLETVAVACELALEAGAVSGDYVLNAISRLKAPPRSAEIATPETLKLKEEPQADLGRYDKLLGKLVLVAAMMAPGFVTEVSRGTP